jgi:hypothetical protein
MQLKDLRQPLKDIAILQLDTPVTELSTRMPFKLYAVSRFGTAMLQRSPIGVSTASDATPVHPQGAPPSGNKNIGFALVGLGKLTLEELMPAFAH